ncbi:cupin domain-containing protein [Ekhidna sp. MALMAid0563]|uniref:cupin domain-containing protein n=1 Tax=Ekhidna sp. MALMAid0563 TaxID=3143937 RepID=UPI0032E0500E
MSEKLFQKLSEIKGEQTAHLSGLKQVFLKNDDSITHLTQFAYGVFEPGEKCPLHRHPTMEELFFFLKGEGTYLIGDTKYHIEPNSFLRIPPNVNHELENTGDERLEFVYFGVALD